MSGQFLMVVLTSMGAMGPLVTNGDFEQVVAHKGQPTGDQGFGTWKLAPKLVTPAGWSLNTGYPGELSVLTTGAQSGKHCLRIRGLTKRGAHLFQPCKDVRPGNRYKVSLWVRGGKASVLFYEYFKDGTIAGTTVATCTAPADRWRQAVGLYTPPTEGFRTASLAVVVTQGKAACVDNVTIERMDAMAPGTDFKPVTLENDAVRMVIAGNGRLKSLVSKASGKEYAATQCPLTVMAAVRQDLHCPATRIRREGDVLVARFVDPDITARIKVTTRDGYFLFEVVDVEPADVTSLELLFPVKRLATTSWAFGGTYDDEFGLCHMAVTPNTRCGIGSRGAAVTASATWYRKHGMQGAKSVFLAVPFDRFLTTIQQMETDTGLPCPVLDGKWAKVSEPVRRSYLFVIGYADGDIDALIEYAKIGHFDTILFGKDDVLETHGHYRFHKTNFPQGLESFKRVVAKIHAAGLRAGLHLWGPTVSPNDPYVTPVPDDRLCYAACPPLAEDMDARSTVLVLKDQPSPLPKAVPSKVFPGRHIRVGDEIVSYGNADVGPPFRFTGCQRGALDTRAAAHKAGTGVRGLLTLHGFPLVDPDTTILKEIAERLGRIVNEAKLDMVYFDASDGIQDAYVDRWYYLQKWHLAFYKAFDHGVLYQTSNGTGSGILWHIVPRSASADGHGDLKGYVDRRLITILNMKKTFTAPDIGWYGLDMHWKPDQLEYVCGRCIGADGSISVQSNRTILENHPRAREIMEMIGRYERCRLADYFPESVKRRLREKKKDFRLFDDGRGGWTLWRAAYHEEHLVDKIDGKANVWTVVNDLGRPCRAAVEITRQAGEVAGAAEYDHPDALVLADFADMAAYGMSDRNQYEQYVVGGSKVLTADGPVSRGVTQQIVRSAAGGRHGKPCAVFTAKNAAEGGGWCGKGKRFAKPLDLSRSEALALWVHGDGKGEMFYFQLRDTAGRWANFNVPVHFTGWRFWAFPRQGQSGFDWERVDYVLFYLVNLPARATVSVKIGSPKALPMTTDREALAGLELAVGDKRFRLPVRLDPGRCITLDGLGGCTFWPGGMKPGRKLDVADATLTLQPGANKLALTVNDPEAYPGDVTVRVSRLWPLEP